MWTVRNTNGLNTRDVDAPSFAILARVRARGMTTNRPHHSPYLSAISCEQSTNLGSHLPRSLWHKVEPGELRSVKKIHRLGEVPPPYKIPRSVSSSGSSHNSPSERERETWIMRQVMRHHKADKSVSREPHTLLSHKRTSPLKNPRCPFLAPDSASKTPVSGL